MELPREIAESNLPALTALESRLGSYKTGFGGEGQGKAKGMEITALIF